MAVNTRVIGLKITCTGKEYIPGKMVENMMATIIWIRNMASVSTSGLMEGSMKVCGIMESNTEKASTHSLMENQEGDYGAREKE